MAKADNLLAVLWLLRSRRRLTAAQIASELETSVRTVYRYIDALCASGVPIVADSGPEGGYTLPESFRSAPLFFEPTELIALFQAAQFARQSGHPYSQALEGALAKVRHNLGPEQEDLVERHTSGFRVARGTGSPPSGPVLGEVEQAVADSATLVMHYSKPGAAQPEERHVEPYGLFVRGGNWYLVAHDRGRVALREFRVDRIGEVRRTGERFPRPDVFAMDQYLREDWVEHQVSAGPHTRIRIQGTPAALASLCEHWYTRHCVVERSEAEVVLQIDPIGYSHMPWHLLGFGTSVRVLEPESLRREMRDCARSLAAQYEET